MNDKNSTSNNKDLSPASSSERLARATTRRMHAADRSGSLPRIRPADDDAVNRMESEGGRPRPTGQHDGLHRTPSWGIDPDETSARWSRRPNSETRWWSREPLSVAEIMTKTVRAVTPETLLHEVAAIMKSEDVGVVPVVDPENRLVGVVTDRDLVVRGMVENQSFADMRVRNVMTESPEAVLADEAIVNALALMGRSQVRRLPVVDDNDHLVGILSLGDIASRADYHDELQDALENISGRRSFWARVWR